ncbi:DMT family transporter [Mesobaculum littorinae]|uniref:DMT family transporter n=1 Tax=Mesobaculum littorinae TaxID=2486419 RepID=UPI001F478D10|nr:DMT family transporter [Mesobaculum littorinae]
MTDRPLLGILLMLGFCVIAPTGDGVAKLLGTRLPMAELVAARFVLQALYLAPLVWLWRLPLRYDRRMLGLMALRTALHMVGITAMFLALRVLPLADCIAIVFVMPFLLLLMGRLFLGEEVGPHRLAACAAGFAGTLLVVQPNFAEVGAPALLPLAVALSFALFMLVTRRVARQVDAVSMQFLNGLMASAVLLPLLALFAATGDAALAPVRPDDATVIWLALLMGALGTGGHLLMTASLRYAPAATLAPMQYLEIPVATVVGFAMFRDLPNGPAAAGIAVTVAAGLYVILRERRLARQSPTPPAPAPVPPGAAGPASPAPTTAAGPAP